MVALFVGGGMGAPSGVMVCVPLKTAEMTAVPRASSMAAHSIE